MQVDEAGFDHILVFNHDIGMYPPILSVVENLVKSGHSVAVVGYIREPRIIAQLNSKGVQYVEVIRNHLNDHAALKLLKLVTYQRRVRAFLRIATRASTLVWLFGNENVWLLSSSVTRYRTVIYLFEVPLLTVSLRYRILNPFVKYGKVMRSAHKVVCCEYNRAHITKSYFGLSELPSVIPNKPETVEDISVDLSSTELANETRKILLYQGIFNFPERRLEALCESVAYLSDEYVVVLMGADSEYKQQLRKQYGSDRVRFISFISPPNHLQITSGAFIGFLNYFATPGDMGACLNTLYCAPNKIFEYSKYGVPMIGNDVPALRKMLDGYSAGICLVDMSPHAIAEAVKTISDDYDGFSAGAYGLYESVDFGALVEAVARRSN